MERLADVEPIEERMHSKIFNLEETQETFKERNELDIKEILKRLESIEESISYLAVQLAISKTSSSYHFIPKKFLTESIINTTSYREWKRIIAYKLTISLPQMEPTSRPENRENIEREGLKRIALQPDVYGGRAEEEALRYDRWTKIDRVVTAGIVASCGGPAFFREYSVRTQMIASAIFGIIGAFYGYKDAKRVLEESRSV